MKRVFAFSGGKDSTAMLCWAKEQGYDFGCDDVIAVWCDTGWKHPLTYEYIDLIDRKLLGGNLVRLKNDRWFSNGGDGMRALVARRGRVPSACARFCTEELKIVPMTTWLRTLDDEATVYVAVRAAESVRRAKLPEREWSEVYDCWIERPLLYWSTNDVFACLARHVEPNPLYKLGAARVGCFPCVMINHAELRRLTTTMPDIWDRISELERLTGRSFFSPGYIPARACSGVDPATGKRFPTVGDVRRWVIEAPQRQIDLFDTGLPVCLSVYSLCE